MESRKLVVILFIISKIYAQDNIGIKFFGLSFHPKGEKENAFLMPRKLDKNAYFVLNLGGTVSYEKFVYKDKYAVKSIVGMYSDCANKFAGFFHIGFRGKIFKNDKHSLYGGIGPTLVFRDSWKIINGYKDHQFFKGDGKWQYVFLWYGGEFEYKYKLSEKTDFAIRFVPGYPHLMNLSLGVNYKL